ncbi:MAG TPA: tRNA pseudouridine(55) synthase TruB [Armatimonadota bacterium]|nr:tRNA pseudouridine(55) synthase TruB [Armatimonadota bacterium]
MICGLLNLDKPSGPTSHDMVSRVRRCLGVRQVGHAGTLDPMATGVLVIGVGPATRLMTFLGDQPKEYAARIRLGLTTDTEDITGNILAEASAAGVTQADLIEALHRFEGPIFQTPPMVSALKVNGRRLYELAREGKSVERQPRAVTVYELELLDFAPGNAAEATLRIRCSGGFYVRTLCADLGRALGCGGCMKALRRTAVGEFRVEDAVTPEALDDAGAAALQPASRALAHRPVVILSEEQRQRVLNGGWIEVSELSPEIPSPGDPEKDSHTQKGSSDKIVRLEDRGGALIAVARARAIDAGARYDHHCSHDGGYSYDHQIRWRCDPYIVLGAPGTEPDRC